MSEPTVTHAHQKYRISVDGSQAGLTAYVDTDTQRIFHHTEVDKAFGGRGIGTKLIGAALDDTRAAGKRIVPVCSFVAHYVDKHGEYKDITDPVTAQAEALADEQSG